jgi:hypothetical protein
MTTREPPAQHVRRLSAAGMLVLGLAGCSLFDRPPTMTSLDAKPVSLELSYIESSYIVQASETSMLFSDVSLQELLEGPPQTGSILHAQILWGPKPGYTPVDATATNVTIRWIVFSGGEVGVYGGAGFCWPRGTLGKGDYAISIEASTLSLIASTAGFVDLASPASITGTFSATFEPERAIRLRQAVSQLVTDAIGRPYWVDAAGVDDRRLAFR